MWGLEKIHHEWVRQGPKSTFDDTILNFSTTSTIKQIPGAYPGIHRAIFWKPTVPQKWTPIDPN